MLRTELNYWLNNASLHSKNDVWKLFKIVKHWVVYTSDKTAHKKFDYWQWPEYTISNEKGDCEDYAILWMYILNTAGYKSSCWRVMGKDGMHMVSTVEIPCRKSIFNSKKVLKTFMLDNASSKLKIVKRKGYLGNNYRWIKEYHWDDLVQRMGK